MADSDDPHRPPGITDPRTRPPPGGSGGSGGSSSGRGSGGSGGSGGRRISLPVLILLTLVGMGVLFGVGFGLGQLLLSGDSSTASGGSSGGSSSAVASPSTQPCVTVQATPSPVPASDITVDVLNSGAPCRLGQDRVRAARRSGGS